MHKICTIIYFRGYDCLNARRVKPEVVERVIGHSRCRNFILELFDFQYLRQNEGGLRALIFE